MEVVDFAEERFKSFGKSTSRFTKGFMQSFRKRASQSPIEILKRLQREVFSDLMKLRERQEKVERLLSFQQSVKKGPFQEALTHMKGIINADGALIFLKNNYHQAVDNLNAAGIRSGIDLRFIFETPIRQRDLLIAEILASHPSLVDPSDMKGSPLALSKLVYLTNISDWFSTVFVPIGAKCIEFGVPTFHEERYEIRPRSFSPPMFHLPESCGIGFVFKKSKLATSLAGLVSGHGAEASSFRNLGLSTFFQASYKPSDEARLTLSWIWKAHRSFQHLKLGPINLPLRSLKNRTIPGSCVEECSSASPRKVANCITAESVALMLESQFDESTNFNFWAEMCKSSPGLWKWGASLCDAPQDEIGWGLKVGGQTEGPLNQLWLEGFLNFNLGKKAVIQPGIVYAVNGEYRTPALLLRSTWFM